MPSNMYVFNRNKFMKISVRLNFVVGTFGKSAEGVREVIENFLVEMNKSVEFIASFVIFQCKMILFLAFARVGRMIIILFFNIYEYEYV